MTYKHKAFVKGTELKHGDWITGKLTIGRKSFAYVTDDGQIATQKRGENVKVYPADNFPGVEVRLHVGTVDLTPTWVSVLPAFRLVLECGTDEGKEIAWAELKRMAEAADAYNASPRRLGS